VAETEVGKIGFTAAAPNRSDRAQLFADVDPAQSMGVTEYYLSLVFDKAAWHAGTYSSAVGGRVSFVLSNGKRYAADGAKLDLTLVVTAAVTGQAEFYLKGQLEMLVPSETSGEPPLKMLVMSH
jgi:hypothetical protein